MSQLRNQITLFVQQNLSQTERTKYLADTAKSALADAINNGASPKFETYVDNSSSSDIDRAKIQVLFRFGYAAQAATFALAYLKQRASPEGSESPHFADSFWLSVDGTYNAPGSFDTATIEPFSEVIIGNTMPYNRKIDVHFSGARKLQYATPAGIYDDTVRATNRQFGNLIAAKRAYDYQFSNKYVQKNAGYTFQSPVVIINVRS